MNGKPDIIAFYPARGNAYAQLSAHAGYFLEHLLGHYLVISCLSSASRVCFCYPHFSPLLIISWLNLNFKKVLSMPTFIIIILAII